MLNHNLSYLHCIGFIPFFFSETLRLNMLWIFFPFFYFFFRFPV